MSTSSYVESPKLYVLYCSLAGFIAAWGISGLLVSIDIVSHTPPGSFFGVIGISLGFYDPFTAQLVGFVLHVITGTIAGNIFGQVSLFWKRMSPYNALHGLKTGTVVGIILWAVFFIPVASIAIQPMLDAFDSGVTPNQYVYSIASNFSGMYFTIILGSLVFHIIYGALLGYMSGRMMDIRAFVYQKTI